MGRLAACGVQFHYEEEGVGEPLLWIPGAFGTGMGDFKDQLGVLSKHFHQIAPDPRGYGQSRPPVRDFPLNFLDRDAEDMASLMSALGHAKFAVAGWSDGANTAVLLALTSPHRVEKLVIWGGNACLTGADMVALDGIRSISSWSERRRNPLEEAYGKDLLRLWKEYCDTTAAIYRRGGELYRRPLGEIHCPTLILHGGKDPLIDDFHPYTFSKSIPDSRLYVFPEGKHNIQSRYATEFNRVVLDFLSERSHR
jgi:valacyclovir hydrolase